MDDLDRALDTFAAVARKRTLSYDGTLLTGRLGFTDSGPVETSRPGYHWVRILEWNSAPVPILNTALTPTAGLPVLVGRAQHSPDEPTVLDVNWGAYGRADLWPSDDASMPPDYRRTTMVQKRQIAPLHGHVITTALTIGVFPDYFYYNGAMVYFPGDDIDISAHVPATGTRYVSVYLVPDSDSGTLASTGGDIVPVLGAGGLLPPETADAFLPAVPAGAIPVVGVRLAAGATAITESDLYDIRLIWNAVGGDTAYIESGLDEMQQLLWVVEQDIDATITTLANSLDAIGRYTNTVTVDAAGRGDFTSIKAACDYVATQSPTATNRWLILVYPNPAGAYTELPFTVPAGCHLVGMQTKPGGNATQGIQIGYSGTWTGGVFITLDSAAHLANVGVLATVDAAAASEAIMVSATAGRINFCQFLLTNNSAQTTSIIKGSMQIEGCSLNPIGNDIRCLYITGSSAVRFCQVFSNGGTNTYGIYQTTGTSTIFFVRLGGSGTSDPDFATDIHRAGGTLILNNVNYRTYSGTATQIAHADRFRNTRSSIREAPASGETPLILKGAVSQSVAIEIDQDSSTAVHNQRAIHSGGSTVFNEQGIDIDHRIEGDTATQLFVVDAGLDAVQIGTTTAGVIADFRSATIVFNENGADRDVRIEGDTDANLLCTDASADMVGVGTNAPTQKLDINSDSIRIRTAKTPASAADTGTQGQIAWDANYLYVCTATNTWKRVAIATW